MEERFEVLERRDHGGNLLALIHPNLRADAVSEEAWQAVLEELLAAEARLLADGAPSFYTVMVARPR